MKNLRDMNLFSIFQLYSHVQIIFLHMFYNFFSYKCGSLLNLFLSKCHITLHKISKLLSLKLPILHFYRPVHPIYIRDTHFHARGKSPTAESQGFILARDEHEVRSSLGRRLRDIHVDRNCHVAARRLA